MEVCEVLMVGRPPSMGGKIEQAKPGTFTQGSHGPGRHGAGRHGPGANGQSPKLQGQHDQPTLHQGRYGQFRQIGQDTADRLHPLHLQLCGPGDQCPSTGGAGQGKL